MGAGRVPNGSKNLEEEQTEKQRLSGIGSGGRLGGDSPATCWHALRGAIRFGVSKKAQFSAIWFNLVQEGWQEGASRYRWTRIFARVPVSFLESRAAQIPCGNYITGGQRRLIS
jgi:hypothetical protein